MRHPKNPFSSDEPADEAALVWPRDRREVAAEAAPGRGRSTPPPLPRRTGDSGFRPHGRQDSSSQDFWPLTDPEDSWPLAPRPQAEPTGSWSPAVPEDSWRADPPAQADPQDPWAQAGPQEPWPASAPAQAGAAGQAPDQVAGATPASTGFQDLWESWEPPYDPIGAISEPVLHPTAPYPELVRDAEYEDELGLWEAPAPEGPGSNEPYYPGPRRRAQHARNAGRPRLSGAFLALAGALAIAGAIPLGMLGARALGHHGNSAPKTAPLSASHAAASARGPNGATTFTALAGPGCPAAAGASVFPYHPANGDDWFPGTASASGPCGRSFSYVYLAMVPGNPGEWRDHYAWIFHTGMDNPSCTFSLYIPAAPQANSTDYYWFSAGDSNAADRIADFTIDQATHQGQWVTKGPFTFPGGTVLIEATDRGEGALTASVAVGPVRLSC